MRKIQLLILRTLIFCLADVCSYAPPSTLAHAAESLTTVSTVSDTKALGYPSNQRLLIDASGAEYFTVRTRDCGSPCRNQFNIALFQSVPGGYDRIWLGDENVSHRPQRAGSIALVGSEVHTVWYGGQETYPQPTSHQIQFARVQAGTPMSILESSTPFYVTGYEFVYGSPSNNDLWQEHPSAVADASGNLHVVWEARDQYCLDHSTGNPVPGIAYAMRTAPTGSWSVSGNLDTPPYLLPGVCRSTSRPIPLVDSGATLHVIANGSVAGATGSRVLYGSLSSGTFSGWTQVAPSADSVNQKNVSAVIDSAGTIQVAWREGPHPLLTNCPCEVLIKYSSRNPSSGVWSAPVVISDSAHYSSTPSIAVNGSTVQVAYVGWVPGTTNRDGVVDNNYPNDTAAVEGSLYVADNSAGGWVEHNVEATDSVSAYPTWKIDSNQLLWTSASTDDMSRCADSTTQAVDCVPLNRGVYVAGTIQ